MHMKTLRKLLAPLAFSLALLAWPLSAAQVTVFAAASLADALKQVGADYEKESGDKITFNFAASGTLVRQIEEGAPADIFFSADEQRADRLEAKGLLVTETRRSLLGNSLVLVSTPDNSTVHSPADLTNAVIQRIAFGNPKTVPAGTYGKAYLEKAGLWPGVEAKIVPCESVRAVLAAVESGNVDAGMVYKTDAAISKKVKAVFEVPAGDGPKITYPVALLKNAPSPEAAKQFLHYLGSPQAGAVFSRFGFAVPSAAGE